MHAHVPLETERLRLRRLVPADAARLFELDSDAEVRRYVHAGPPDLDRIRDEVLPRMRAYDDRDDLGFFAAEEKPTGAFIGWLCLRPADGPDGECTPDLGFRLRRSAWGRGLATEGSRALVTRAFALPATSRVEAVALVENRASQRVLEKVGFLATRDFLYELPALAVREHPVGNRLARRFVLTRSRFRGVRRAGGAPGAFGSVLPPR